MNAFWGLGQLMFSKTIIVVDKDVNVQDLSGGRLDRRHAHRSAARHPDDEGAGRRSGRCRDLPAYGGKMGIDATRKWASEGFTRTWPTRNQDQPDGAAAGGGRSGRRIRQGWKA